MYSAIYLPSLRDGQADPSQSGFPTNEAAEEFVFSQMCKSCQAERAAALAGEEADIEAGFLPSTWPGCACEWLTGLTQEFDDAETCGDKMKAGGWELVYKRPEPSIASSTDIIEQAG